MSNIDTHKKSAETSVVDGLGNASPLISGVSRRKLVRAGLAAVPVIAALKSNTVLAGDHTCIRPSSFASLTIANMTVSRGRTIDTNYYCKSHGFWKNNNAGTITDTYKNNTKFISTTTGLTYNPGSGYTNLSLMDVLWENYPGVKPIDAAMAKHIAGTYLSAIAFPTTAMVPLEQCQRFWNGSDFSPFSSRAEAYNYLDKIYDDDHPIVITEL